MEAFSIVRHFDRFWGFLKTFSEKWDTFDFKCEAIIKIMRLFEDIFREMESLIRNLSLLQRHFQWN
jgi:hypothetical protein